jgi:hypothetical protein
MIKIKNLFSCSCQAPFLALWAVWLAYWSQQLGIDEHWELGCIVCAGLIILQVSLSSLI